MNYSNTKLKSKTYFQYEGDVIDLQIANHPSYNVANIIVHNSAGGSLLAYLFDITKVDPVKYNLLFARFLNKSRIKEGLPDIDIDFMSSRRQEVKDYIVQRFGYINTCFTGTYTTLKLKGALKDIGREMGLDFQQINYITAGAIEEREEWNWFDIFEYAQNNSSVKNFIQNNFELLNNIQVVLNQPKSQSIHASAVIITPTKNQEGETVSIFDWMPVKLMGEHIVSEWEGAYLDKAGFLKEDILSTSQLDKLFEIIALIYKNRNIVLDPFNIPIDDKKTFEYFQRGLTEDVFHFGSPALKVYCQDVKPDNIHELIAMNALYRPGPMASNAHNDFALIKFGKKQPEYDWGCEEILKPTYGIFTYQEQAIEIVQKVGGFTEAEADNVRRAIGKKILTLMQSYKIQFIEQATQRGCPEQEAIKIWKKIEDFSAYSFNRCVSGTEKIFRLGQTKTAFEPTIEEMYMIYNSYSYAKKTGHKSLYSKYRTYGYGNAYSMNSDNRLIKNHIVNITFAGIREVFLVTTESGKAIKVTNNHKFPTSSGEKLLKDIDIERDLLYVNDGYEIEDTSYRWGTDNRTPSSIGFLSQDTDYTRFQAIERELKANHKSCQKCDKEHRRLEVHHKDKNHSNNVPENCILLCPSCHKKEEYKLGRVKVGEKGLLTKLERIISIVNIGKENVYDVEMAAPYHTFANNDGIVTCNSHATTYSLTGYACNYLKAQYPLEFWTASLQHSKDYELPRRIAEMNKLQSHIKLSPPDINNSLKIFTANSQENIIYWSIGNVAYNGDVAVDIILEEREKNGNFYSLKEFYVRIPKKSVNKRALLNLILAGCFDEICGIQEPKNRLDIIHQYCKLTKSELPALFDIDSMSYNWYWILLQKDMCGFGYLDYDKLLLQSSITKPNRFVDPATLSLEIPENQKQEIEIIVAGVLIEIVERSSKKGMFCNIVLDSNGEQVRCLLWNEIYVKFKNLINNNKGKILFISGKKKYDSFRKVNILSSTETTEITVL